MKRTTKTAAFGGAVAIVMAVGAWLANLFTGAGGNGLPGGREDRGPDPPAATAPPEAVDERPVPTPPPEEAPVDLRLLEPPSVLEVVITDGDRYEIRLPGEGDVRYVPADLAQVVELALRARGNDEGVRVRVQSRPSARVLGEQNLREALRESGLDRDSVRWEEVLLTE